MMDREELGRKIFEVSQACSDGYRRGITSLSTDAEKDMNEKCACAASNTGFFLLQALGYTKEDMDRYR